MLHLLQKMVIYDLDFFLDFYGAAGPRIALSWLQTTSQYTCCCCCSTCIRESSSTVSITVIRFASSCIIVASVQQASVSQQRWSHFLSHAFFTSWDFSLTLFNVSANSHHYHFPAPFFAFKAFKMLSFDFGGIDDQEHLSITSGPCFLIKYFFAFKRNFCFLVFCSTLSEQKPWKIVLVAWTFVL